MRTAGDGHSPSLSITPSMLTYPCSLLLDEAPPVMDLKTLKLELLERIALLEDEARLLAGRQVPLPRLIGRSSGRARNLALA
jgi:hypothetical protein